MQARRIIWPAVGRAELTEFDLPPLAPGTALIETAHNFVRPEHDSSPGHWTMRDDVLTVLCLLAAGRLRVQPMISEVVSPEQATAVYHRLAETECPPLGVVFDWQGKDANP